MEKDTVLKRTTLMTMMVGVLLMTGTASSQAAPEAAPAAVAEPVRVYLGLRQVQVMFGADGCMPTRTHKGHDTTTGYCAPVKEKEGGGRRAPEEDGQRALSHFTNLTTGQPFIIERGDGPTNPCAPGGQIVRRDRDKKARTETYKCEVKGKR